MALYANTNNDKFWYLITKAHNKNSYLHTLKTPDERKWLKISKLEQLVQFCLQFSDLWFVRLSCIADIMLKWFWLIWRIESQHCSWLNWYTEDDLWNIHSSVDETVGWINHLLKTEDINWKKCTVLYCIVMSLIRCRITSQWKVNRQLKLKNPMIITDLMPCLASVSVCEWCLRGRAVTVLTWSV